MPRQHGGARMGVRGTGEREGQGGWRCMLITSGAAGRALQVSVPQRTIHSGSEPTHLERLAIGPLQSVHKSHKSQLMLDITQQRSSESQTLQSP